MALDLSSTIEMLRTRLKSVDSMLASLGETVRATSGTQYNRRSTRGRKSMGAEERLEVSARMKRYWADRRRA